MESLHGLKGEGGCPLQGLRHLGPVKIRGPAMVFLFVFSKPEVEFGGRWRKLFFRQAKWQGHKTEFTQSKETNPGLHDSRDSADFANSKPETRNRIPRNRTLALALSPGLGPLGTQP